jgi:hypothetical protein
MEGVDPFDVEPSRMKAGAGLGDPAKGFRQAVKAVVT